ncbi:hypothetical protein LDENG_00227360 [Lucifuga dentata]|nr:hypothetical protein LDENG_00227360 [Lucifuga dentata]
MDSYDKLKPYGIAINGCIDGFSHLVLWTNSDPEVIAGYYIQCVEHLQGCPERIRADSGTKNGHVANMQVFLRRNDTHTFAKEKSFICGRSTANALSHGGWGILRKQCVQFWMNMFKAIQDNSHFSGDLMDQSLIQFCFLNLVPYSKKPFYSKTQ